MKPGPGQHELLTTWLDTATAGLCAEAKTRIRGEIEEHFEAACEDALEHGLSEQDAVQQAIASLGDARKARRSFRRIHLTQFEKEYTDNLLALRGEGLRTWFVVRCAAIPIAPLMLLGGLLLLFGLSTPEAFLYGCILVATALAGAVVVALLLLAYRLFRTLLPPSKTAQTALWRNFSSWAALTCLLISAYGHEYLRSSLSLSALPILQYVIVISAPVWHMAIDLRIMRKLRARNDPDVERMT